MATSKAQVVQSLKSVGLPQPVEQMVVTGLNDTVIAGAFGVSPDQVDVDRATLVLLIGDATGSMDSYRSDFINSANAFFENLKKSRNREAIICSFWTFNARTGPRLVFSWTKVSGIPVITESDYDPDAETPLYDSVFDGLRSMAAYAETLRRSGTMVECIAIVASDGYENASRQHSADDVRQLAQSLLALETWRLGYIGFGSRDLADVAGDIGFPAILIDTKDPKGMRRALDQASESVVSASQTTVTASKPTNFFQM